MLKNEDTNKIKYLVSHFLFLFVVIFSIFAFSTITSQAYVQTNLSPQQLEEVNRIWGPASNHQRFPHFLGVNQSWKPYPYGVNGAYDVLYSGNDYLGESWYTNSQTAGPFRAGKYYTKQSAYAGYYSFTHEGNFVIVTQGTGTVTMGSWTYGDKPSDPSIDNNTNPKGSVTYRYYGTGDTQHNNNNQKPTNPGTYRVEATVGTDTQKYSLGYTTSTTFTIHAATPDPDPTPDPEPEVNVTRNSATIAKHLKMTSETQLPDGITFNFNFAKVSLDGDTGRTSDMPEIGSVSAAINGTSQKSESDGVTTYIAESEDFIAKFLAANGNKAPADGTYVYTVKEATSITGYNLVNTDKIKENITYSTMTYTVEITVTRDADGNVTVTTVVTKPSGEKANPTPGSSDMVFENTFVRTFTGTGEDNVSLRVKKIVKSNFGGGDTNQIFNFSITVTSAATVGEAKTYSYKVVDATGKVHKEGTLTSGVDEKFTMGNGYMLLVDGLEVGATYTITEDGLHNWTASYTINGSPSETGRANEGITISDKKILDQQVNEVEITNTYNSQTPTGILMSNLPFNTMVILSVGILTLVAITNSKKKAKRA